MTKFKVVVADDRYKIYEEEKAILSSINAELVVANCFTAEEVIAVCKDADGLLVNLVPITATVIEQLDKCKVISRYGVGYDNVDVEACTSKGIVLTNPETVSNPDLIKKLSGQSHLLWCKDINQLERFLKYSKKFKPKKYKKPKCNIHKTIERSFSS